MTEGDQAIFAENLEAFHQFWETRQPKFVAYFRQNYASRVGQFIISYLTQYFIVELKGIRMCMYIHATAFTVLACVTLHALACIP